MESKNDKIMYDNEILTDRDLVEKIKNCTLEPEMFNHESMLRLTWILINEHGVEKATEKNIELKKNYFSNVLPDYKFHKELTIAYTEILYHFMKKTPSKDFEKLLQEFPRLRHNFKKLVKTHFGYDILKGYKLVEPEATQPIIFNF